MTDKITEYLWRTCSSIRIVHPELDIDRITEELGVIGDISQKPGESRVPYGECRSAGYWVKDYRFDDSQKPDQVISVSENFIAEHESVFQRLLEENCKIDVYIAIFTNILSLGFVLPPIPIIRKLKIPIGIEFFSS